MLLVKGITLLSLNRLISSFRFICLCLLGFQILWRPLTGVSLTNGIDYSGDTDPLPKLDSNFHTIDYFGDGLLSGVKFGSVNSGNAAILANVDFTSLTNTLDVIKTTEADAFRNVIADKCVFTNITLDGSGVKSLFRGASFVGANFSEATILGSSSTFRDANFTNANFSKTNITLSGNSNFRNADSHNANFSEAVISLGLSKEGDEHFRRTDLMNCDFSGAVINVQPGALLSDGSHQFLDVNFSGADLQSDPDWTATMLSNLDKSTDVKWYDTATRFPDEYAPSSEKGWYMIQSAPSGEASNFLAKAPNSSTLILTWDDFTSGSTNPDGYLILVNDSGYDKAPFLNGPSDGVAIKQDPNLDDGIAMVKVPQGHGYYNGFINANAGKKYYFQVYAYTNGGTAIQYFPTAGVQATATTHAHLAFQPYNTQGDNLIHVKTADFHNWGANPDARDSVVAFTALGKLIAFKRVKEITDPIVDNRLWEYDIGQFAVGFKCSDINNDGIDEVLVPSVDGHLRIFDSSGALKMDLAVSEGALYSVAVGKTTVGFTRIVVGSVDGYIYFYNKKGVLKGTIPAQANNKKGVVRRIVCGDFDGVGGDEVVAFFDTAGFSSGNYFEITDLDTLKRPQYWNGVLAANKVDLQGLLGWTDKNLAWSYDMDGDGDDEVVGHWGVLHPESGPGVGVLPTMLREGERLRLEEEYQKVFESTNTGKYIMQQGIPGNFREDPFHPGSEMITVYGDDLYLVNYDTRNAAEINRFRVSDYGYAHTLYHFTDGARLESRTGGLDCLVLAGPNNGDDHFYVVDFSGEQWKEEAKRINGRGKLGQVSSNLEKLEVDIDGFDGTLARAGGPIRFIHAMPGAPGWWVMNAENIDANTELTRAAMEWWKDQIGGSENVRLYMDSKAYVIGPDALDTMTEETIVAWCAAMASKGLFFCLKIGHGDHVAITAENLADCLTASYVDGTNYMMCRTRELKYASDFDYYVPHMDALIERASALGIPLSEYPKVQLSAKGAVFSMMTPSQVADFFPKYKDILVLGTEMSNVTIPDFSISERVGLWLNGNVENWSCNPIGDYMATNRVKEFGATKNGHVTFRNMLSCYALGADIFRVTSITGKDNPLYLRGDTTNPKLALSNPYRQGIIPFLKLVESGVYPAKPDRSQLKGISPVAAALPVPVKRLADQSINHDYFRYKVQDKTYTINNLECWNAYTEVPDVDLTRILLNTRTRWNNILPTSPSGFVAIVPHASRTTLEGKARWNRAYETDGNSWAEFGTLEEGRDAIRAELLNQRANLPFYVDSQLGEECFWQVTQQKGDPDLCFLVLMDNDIHNPKARTVKLRLGSATDGWDVFDQFSSQAKSLGTLVDADSVLTLGIPAGSVRVLALKRRVLTLYDIWEARHGILGAGKTSDSDNDGWSNDFEYKFGMNPLNNLNNGKPSPEMKGNYPGFYYRYRTDAAGGISYTVERSYDLRHWTIVQVNDGVSRSGNAIEFSAPRDNNDGTYTIGIRSDVDLEQKPLQFFRVRVNDNLK